jgi:hypothetical protein
MDTVKVETDVSIDNEEDVTGMETDAVCLPKQCEPEVSYIWSWFFVVVVVDVYCCVCFCTHGTAEIG